MAEQKRTMQTLVGAMRETNWWPPDVPSSLKGKVCGEVVVLDAVAPVDFDQLQWKVHSEKADSTSLPVPFKRYEIFFVVAPIDPEPRWPWQKPRSLGPTHFHVLVADVGDPKNINPLTDCCALVPFDQTNEVLSPSGRIEFAKRAIVVRLTGMGAWPHKKPMSVMEAAANTTEDSSAITLERGREVPFNPNEWSPAMIAGTIGEPPIGNIMMFHNPTQLGFSLYIYVDKLTDPATIDPYADCCVRNPKSTFLKIYEASKAEDLKPPPLPKDEVIEELSRAAIVVYLRRIGARAPGSAQRPPAEPIGLSLIEHLKRNSREAHPGAPMALVGLDAIAPIGFTVASWESRLTDEHQSGYARRFEMIHLPSNEHVEVHFVGDPTNINPLMDCAAIIPTKHPNHIAIAKEGLIVQLSVLGAWPYPEVNTSKNEKAELRAAIEPVLSKLEELSAGWPRVASSIDAAWKIQDLRGAIAHLDAGHTFPDFATRTLILRSFLSDLQELDRRRDDMERQMATDQKQ